MKVVEYKKHISEDGRLIDPPWLVVPSMFYDEDTKTYVGLVLDESDRDYYIPDTVTVLTKVDLIERLTKLHAQRPFRKKILVDDVLQRVEAESAEDYVEYWWNKQSLT